MINGREKGWCQRAEAFVSLQLFRITLTEIKESWASLLLKLFQASACFITRHKNHFTIDLLHVPTFRDLPLKPSSNETSLKLLVTRYSLLKNLMDLFTEFTSSLPLNGSLGLSKLSLMIRKENHESAFFRRARQFSLRRWEKRGESKQCQELKYIWLKGVAEKSLRHANKKWSSLYWNFISFIKHLAFYATVV